MICRPYRCRESSLLSLDDIRCDNLHGLGDRLAFENVEQIVLDHANLSHTGDISQPMSYGYTVSMVKRLVDIDDDALERARRVLGTGTMKETVNSALREVVDLDRRRRFIDRIMTSDGLDLDDDEVMDRAWR